MEDFEDAARSWFRVDAVLPGERVPNWVYVGWAYEGVRGPETLEEVKLFSADGTSSVILAAQLLTELPGPPS